MDTSDLHRSGYRQHLTAPGERRIHDVLELGISDETTDHLETLAETKSLLDQKLYSNLHGRLQELGKKLNLFMQSVERSHISEK